MDWFFFDLLHNLLIFLYRIQWFNILRELEDCALTLRHEEVYILMTQTSWQLGPLSDSYTSRTWHEELGAGHFAHRLIEACQKVHGNIKDNWLESITLKTLSTYPIAFATHDSQIPWLVMLVCRMLASSQLGEHDIRQEGFSFLLAARATAFRWLGEVKSAMIANADDDENSKYYHLICEMAMICRITYDVDHQDLRSVLRSPEDISILIQCAIALQQNQPPSLDDAPSHIQTMLCRDRRLSHKLQWHLVDCISTDWRGFHMAIQHVWETYRAGEKREIMPGGHWVFVETETTGSSAQNVHYNLIDGLLLIDGKPMGRLPREYTTHATYARVFGSVRPLSKIVDVTRSLLSTLEDLRREA
jgi:hypothetical protein